MSAPADVQRIVEVDELPASVREIPSGCNPLEDGLLMLHQINWLQDKSDLKVVEKGRRTGLTYAEALDDTITSASQKSAGGDNVYYVGDTKEKGLEFIGYCAHMAKVMALAMADGWQGIEVILFEDKPDDGDSKFITAYRIRFASGFQIVALSSNPANIRGLQGIVVIDEAAFHRDVNGVIESALALIIWGGKIRIISTHNGDKSAFNQLIKDSRAGLYKFSVHRYTFDNAVANGLYERVCFMKGTTPTAEGKREWYNNVRGAYGTRTAAMKEELDAIPREGNGVAIPGILIERCMPEERPVLRLALNSEFALKDEAYRKSWCNDWIKIHLDPLLKLLNPLNRHVYGEDFARYGDFSVIAPMEVKQNLTRSVPFIVEMHNVPTRQQEQILWHIIRALPRFSKAAMDASGNGFTLAEYTADKFGHSIIEMVMLNNAWYRENMVALQQAFEDGTIELPRDADIKNDIRTLEQIDGVIKPPKQREDDTKGEFKRHADSAIAIALAYWASQQDGHEIDYTAGPDKRNRWDISADDEDEESNSFGGAGAW